MTLTGPRTGETISPYVNPMETPVTIAVSIEPHGISTLTALTAPMWGACNIQCPVMVGAECAEFDDAGATP